MSAPLIEPEDRQPDEQVTLRLRPDVVRDLRAYGQYANDSTPSYVVAAALKRLFTADKGFLAYKQENPDVGAIVIQKTGKSRIGSNAKS